MKLKRGNKFNSVTPFWYTTIEEVNEGKFKFLPDTWYYCANDLNYSPYGELTEKILYDKSLDLFIFVDMQVMPSARIVTNDFLNNYKYFIQKTKKNA